MLRSQEATARWLSVIATMTTRQWRHRFRISRSRTPGRHRIGAVWGVNHTLGILSQDNQYPFCLDCPQCVNESECPLRTSQPSRRSERSGVGACRGRPPRIAMEAAVTRLDRHLGSQPPSDNHSRKAVTVVGRSWIRIGTRGRPMRTRIVSRHAFQHRDGKGKDRETGQYSSVSCGCPLYHNRTCPVFLFTRRGLT